jgi:hypothetical protein
LDHVTNIITWFKSVYKPSLAKEAIIFKPIIDEKLINQYKKKIHNLLNDGQFDGRMDGEIIRWMDGIILQYHHTMVNTSVNRNQ